MFFQLKQQNVRYMYVFALPMAIIYTFGMIIVWKLKLRFIENSDQNIQQQKQLEKLNPFAPGDFAEKRVLKLVEWFSGHCRAIKS